MIHLLILTHETAHLARDFKEAQEAVAALFKDRIVIGHSVKNDFRVRCPPWLWIFLQPE